MPFYPQCRQQQYLLNDENNELFSRKRTYIAIIITIVATCLITNFATLDVCFEPDDNLVSLQETLEPSQLGQWMKFSSPIYAYWLQMRVVFDIFADSGVLEYFKLDERILASWISKVASNYKENPYHNFSHATHVLHCVFLFLMTTEANNYLTRVDQLALLIAAICHDIDHDGDLWIPLWDLFPVIRMNSWMFAFRHSGILAPHCKGLENVITHSLFRANQNYSVRPFYAAKVDFMRLPLTVLFPILICKLFLYIFLKANGSKACL